MDARAAHARAQPVVAWCEGRAGSVDEKEEGLVSALLAKKEPQKVHVGSRHILAARALDAEAEFWSRLFGN